MSCADHEQYAAMAIVSTVLSVALFVIGYNLGVSADTVDAHYWIKCRGELTDIYVSYAKGNITAKGGGCSLTKWKYTTKDLISKTAPGGSR